ncbi:hypothetical protein [Peredibacter starrii]|uniref:PilZ domain-containing protein n=1 Tax=Peredibacter starrii TaxID=28202 RepID=A0AAX4HPZ1_9BACT|nr:hypothetical protein [Peredibacter starrii]WPU65329.1 hypothetical protein SOO65_01050 [Peredibacter starrii]
MEQLKVKKKDILILNVVAYLGLAFFFLYLQHAYRHHISPFSLVYLKKGLELFWYVALTLGASAILIWRHHRYSIIVYAASIILVGFKVLEGLFIEFNKIIVVALFFYTVISYFLYQLLNYYLSLASINTNYSHQDLFDPLLKKIPCKIRWEDNEVEGNLSNWDFEGCFIKLDEAKTFPTKVTLEVTFQERQFTQEGEVVAETLDLTGVGIRFERKAKELNVFNWTEFMDLAQELGFQPERLR